MFRGSQLLSGHVFSLSVRRLLQSTSKEAFRVIKLSPAHHKIHTSSYFYAIRTINVPSFPESISEGDITWRKSVGDTVQADEVVAEVETDKTSIPVISPVAGVISELLFEEGAKVTYDQPLVKIDEREATPGEIPPAAKTEDFALSGTDESTSAAPSPAEWKSESPISPRSPSLAEPAPRPSHVAGPTTFFPTSAFPVMARTEQRVKMTRIRARTAERLKEAQNTCAMLTTFNEIDMSNLIDMRTQYKEAFLKKHGVKIGIMSCFSKAAVFALQDQPIVNAYIDGKEVVYRNYIDLSIAVASPKGLVVPVLRNVESMDFAAIERGIFELGEKAKSGNIAVEDMDGGTFTISNGGVFGSLFSTPIVNPPQSAILGLHGTFDRPVVRNGQVVVRPMMYVALSYDHRLIDGREAVLFLRKIKAFVEDPRVFFLNL
ncbi:Dihydrolipoyllysine-residue succinyltransferase component of 2-oxoglutarate dehydrogenase complex mitochondrial [Taenia solium]|eukprot:TsM_000168700 transcript=TsM_000168700 gene=TsM_000168700